MDQMQIDYEADKADRAEARERRCSELLVAFRNGTVNFIPAYQPEDARQTKAHHMMDAVLALDFLVHVEGELRGYAYIEARDQLLSDFLDLGVEVGI